MLPEELLIAYQTFTLLATKYKYAYAGFMMSADPAEMIGIGNVTEKAHELATLLRRYADLIDDKSEKGLIVEPHKHVN